MEWKDIFQLMKHSRKKKDESRKYVEEIIEERKAKSRNQMAFGRYYWRNMNLLMKRLWR